MRTKPRKEKSGLVTTIEEGIPEDRIYAEVRKIEDRIQAIYRKHASVYVSTKGVAVIIGTDSYAAKSIDDLPEEIRILTYRYIFNLTN